MLLRNSLGRPRAAEWTRRSDMPLPVRLNGFIYNIKCYPTIIVGSDISLYWVDII